jgi:two-component system, cell cycle sensor histidine kinase and response regulator CckA
MGSKTKDTRKQAGLLEEQVRNRDQEKQSLLKAKEMAISLGDFQSSLNQIENSQVILTTTAANVREMIRFKVVSFYLVNEQDSSFYQAYCDPEDSSPSIENEVNVLINDKTFSFALRVNKPTFITSAGSSEQIMLHPLFTSSRTRGMFLGVLAQDRESISDISLILFTMAIVANAYALESFGLYRQIQDINKEMAANIIKMEISKKELIKANEELLQDILKRKLAEKALRQAEAQYRSIFENATDGIFQIAPEGYYINANPALARIHGFETPAELTRKVTDIAGQLCIDRGQYEAFLRRLDQEGAVSNLEMQMYRKDGQTNWVLINAHVVRNEKVALLYYEGTMKDITETKILESRLRHAQKMEAIGTLAGGIAHDFNNLLAGIQGFATLSLLDIDASHPNYEKLKRIGQQVQSGANLTRQLLGFARGEKYEAKPADMNDILEKTSHMFGRTKKEISIQRRFEEALWKVEVDQGQMEQVFMNLYVNAWQAMPEGGNIYLETDNIFGDDEQAIFPAVNSGRYVKITVTDTGTGMDEKTKERIFEPFFTTKKMGTGTGLGLATVYGIIKGHKGMINVTSKLGQGTIFTIYLPASEKEVIADKRPIVTIARGEETILLVDDEKMVLEVNKQLIESLGYRVYAAGSGQAAIAGYMEKRDKIDLVILDMIMPGISGGETFDRLREINPDIRVILCSGYSIAGDAQKIMDRGCNGFMQKPFFLRDLSHKLREVLDKKSKHEK